MNRQWTLAALIAGCLLAIAQLAAATAEPQQAADRRVADLARAGKVRVGLFLPQYIKDRRPGSSGACGSKQREHLPGISAFSSSSWNMRRRRKPLPASRRARAT